MAVVAFAIAAVLIVVAGALVVRAEWSVLPRGRGAGLERLWIVLPALFLVSLLLMAGARGVW